MLTANVTYTNPDGSEIKATVRSRNRKTSITEAWYRQLLLDAYPEAGKVNIGKLIEIQNTSKTAEEIGERVINEFGLQSYGLTTLNNIDAFVPIAARMIAIEGEPFAVGNDSRFTPSELVKAYEHFLNEEADNGFWIETAKAIIGLDQPLASPIEAVNTPSDNPLSVAPVSDGSAA